MSTFALPTDSTEVGQTAEGITRLCRENLAHAERVLEEIRALQYAADEALTWATTAGRFDDVWLLLAHASWFAQLMAVAHPLADVREAARACEPEVDRFQTSLYLDEVLAQVIKRYAARHEPLSPARARLLAHILRDYRRNGLDLDSNKRARLRELNEEITAISLKFDENLATTTLAIDVTPSQLAGLPPSYVQSHPAGANGTIRITTDYPDYFPFLHYAHDREAARELAWQFENRAAAENVPLLERLLDLRREKAVLLGYATWADYVMEPRMAKTAARVHTFLEGLRDDVRAGSKRELQWLQAANEQRGAPRDAPIATCDRPYLEDQVRQTQFGLDSQALSEYFEVSQVLNGVLQLSSQLYGISYRPVKCPVWHDDVQVFEVTDTASGDVWGRIYLDLYPREGKFKHAAVFGLRPSRRLPDGQRLVPLAAMVCNFPKSTPGTPALLSHSDVVTLFHEFGHLLHDLLTESELASFSGTMVARDFVEVPSQLFEEWAWSRETLDRFARHVRTGAPLPEAMYESMIRARSFGRALATGRQLFLSALDLKYHTTGYAGDSTKVVYDTQAEYSPFEPLAGTHFQASFGHLIGYDAGYYGYQWALAIARDVFTRFEREGLMNPQTAADYRRCILAPGGSDDEEQLVERFLGRPFQPEAYRQYLVG